MFRGLWNADIGYNHLWVSWFVYSHKVFYLDPADWTLPQILRAFYTSSVMFTGHVHTVFVIFIANNASIGDSFLSYICCLYFTTICLIWSKFKDQFIWQFFKIAGLSLNRQSLPRSIGCPHVLQVKPALYRKYCGMKVTQMLVFWEVYRICVFSPNAGFWIFGDFIN